MTCIGSNPQIYDGSAPTSFNQNFQFQTVTCDSPTASSTDSILFSSLYGGGFIVFLLVVIMFLIMLRPISTGYAE